ncbi:hypothetical protein V6R21_18220 [Limibacter armeniacum]|uniref:hypothetical protein n=1 Tax=Limibacter armeniacum TaxID=466084 RepID=UPI002FE54376
MKELTQTLIYIHAFLGGLGLLSGIASVITKKGSKPHTQSGKVFSIAMIGSAVLSLIVARVPEHENLFLFLIGIFTIYMVLAGNRALTLKYPNKSQADIIDKSISGLMLLGSIAMLAIGGYNLTKNNNEGTLFLFFGGFGLFMTITDFKSFKTFKEQKSLRLKNHIGRMVGALIASFTAFIVAGLNLNSTIAWISPTIVGTMYIIFWTRKLKTDKRPIEEKQLIK